jgi:hypothetical protein
MIVEIGSLCLVLALGRSVAQVLLSAAGVGRPLLAGAGEGAATGVFLALVISFAALIYAFVTSDFSVANVAANSHSAKPLLYRVAGAWGSHEGSMVLWCLALTGFGAAVGWFGRDLPADLRTRTLAVQGGLGVLFLAYTVFASNPMLRLADTPPLHCAAHRTPLHWLCCARHKAWACKAWRRPVRMCLAASAPPPRHMCAKPFQICWCSMVALAMWALSPPSLIAAEVRRCCCALAC